MAAEIGDPVLLSGRPVGAITSPLLSPTLERSIAIAMVEAQAATQGERLEVRLGEETVAATVVPMPFFDPERKLARA